MHEGTVSLMMDQKFPLFKSPKLRSTKLTSYFITLTRSLDKRGHKTGGRRTRKDETYSI